MFCNVTNFTHLVAAAEIGLVALIDYDVMITFVVLNAGVVGRALGTEGQTEYVAVIWTVPHQEWPVHLVGQLRLSIVPVQWAPVPAALQGQDKVVT